MLGEEADEVLVMGRLGQREVLLGKVAHRAPDCAVLLRPRGRRGRRRAGRDSRHSGPAASAAAPRVRACTRPRRRAGCGPAGQERRPGRAGRRARTQAAPDVHGGSGCGRPAGAGPVGPPDAEVPHGHSFSCQVGGPAGSGAGWADALSSTQPLCTHRSLTQRSTLSAQCDHLPVFTARDLHPSTLRMTHLTHTCVSGHPPRHPARRPTGATRAHTQVSARPPRQKPALPACSTEPPFVHVPSAHLRPKVPACSARRPPERLFCPGNCAVAAGGRSGPLHRVMRSEQLRPPGRRPRTRTRPPPYPPDPNRPARPAQGRRRRPRCCRVHAAVEFLAAVTMGGRMLLDDMSVPAAVARAWRPLETAFPCCTS
ncbi:hypothetical protein SALBM135S_09586 [Streptomyces alboniger]